MFLIDYESSDTISLEKGTDYTVRYETPSFYLQSFSYIYFESVKNIKVLSLHTEHSFISS